MPVVLNKVELLLESFLRHAVDLLVRLVEAASAETIFVGAVLAITQFMLVLVGRRMTPHCSGDDGDDRQRDRHGQVTVR